MRNLFSPRRRDVFLAAEDGEDSAAGPSQRTFSAESSAEAIAERSRRLATRTKNKTERSVHRRSQESKKKFSSRKHVLEVLHAHARYLGLIFALPLFCAALCTHTKRVTPDTCAARPIRAHGAWSGARHHTHAYS